MRWEYKVSNAPTTPRELQAVLDHDGCEEWELVCATPFASRLILLFKRPAQNVEEPCAEVETVQETVSETGEVEIPQDENSVMAEADEQTETVPE